MIENQEKEIIQQRLTKLLQLRNWMILPMMFGAGWFIFTYIIGNDPNPGKPPTNFLTLWVFVGYQIVVWAWISYVRKTLSAITPGGPRRCFVGNILLIIASFIFFPLCTFFLRDLFGFFMGLLLATFMLLLLTFVNRFIKLLYFDNGPSQQSYELSSPCPGMFQIMNQAKSMWALPIFLFVPVFLLLVIIKFCVKDAQVPWGMIWCWAGVFGLAGLIAAILMTGPYCLIKQTSYPSSFQRWIRKFLLTHPGRPIHLLPSHEIVAFKWWLSHPGEPWPENMQELCKHIDTSKFDWQDPTEWDFVLAQAAGRFMDPKEPLEIGSKANLFRE